MSSKINAQEKQILYDNHGRPLTYLRLAITDRCNLRCFYCMPAHGIEYLPKPEVMTFEEMERMVKILANMGISKVRITGGEPFVRRNLIDFLWKLREIKGLEEIHITTNGVLTHSYLSELIALKINSVNLSLDTLDPKRFYEITRRDELSQVIKTYHGLLENGIKMKINAVVMEGKNTEDLIALAELTQKDSVEVRFIEEMPFNGEGTHYPILHWNYHKIRQTLEAHYPELERSQDEPFATAQSFQIPSYKGKIGIIAAFSRTFCGTCNRIRVTPQGTLKTCLYDGGVLNIRDLMRAGQEDEMLQMAFLKAFRNRAKDGFEAEQSRKTVVSESMSTIGG
jgi:cyclic pyranopterin phosphate synthase